MTVKMIEIKVKLVSSELFGDRCETYEEILDKKTPAIVGNGIGLHRSVNGDSWIITHLNTGHAVLIFDDFKTAYKIFNWIKDNSVGVFDFCLPEFTDDFQFWLSDAVKFALQENNLEADDHFLRSIK